MATTRIIWLPLGMRIIQYSDIEGMRKILKVQHERLSNTGPFLKGVANILRADYRRQFSVGGDPKWKSLSPSTIREKQQSGYPRLTAKGRIPRRLVQNGMFDASNILIRSGKLRDAWSTLGSPDHFEKIDVKECSVKMGPKLDKLRYARIQQLGGIVNLNGHSVTIPARPVRNSEEAIRRIVNYSHEYFLTAKNGNVNDGSQ